MSVALSDPAPRAARLARALEAGLTLPAQGRIAVLRARAQEDLTPLPRARLHMVQGFRPDHDALASVGYSVSAGPQGRYAAALVCLPRSKAQARALIAQAAALSDGPVLVDGQKDDGIESVLRDLRARVTVDGVEARAHGKLCWFTPDAGALADWAARPQRLQDPMAPGFVTLPGVFSADAADPGSRLLAGALPASLGAAAADLGAGWGFLAAQALRRADLATLHLIEAEHDALECARANIADPRAQFHWADATAFALARPVNTVICNPPFHAGRRARPELGGAFIAAAARLLVPDGTLWLVANRHLPYAPMLQAAFRGCTLMADDQSFRVWRATAPRNR